MRRETREIDRFRAASDGGEVEVTLVVFQDFIDAPTRENPNGVVAGLKSVRTAEGFAVNRIDDNTFQIVNDPFHPELIVRRVET